MKRSSFTSGKRRCKVCKTPFWKRSISHVACSPDCALQLVNLQREKLIAADTKVRKERLKRRADYLADAQRAVNAYVQVRDAGLPCISCGTTTAAQYHAGHFVSRGAHPELRFEPLNIHRQCQKCNTYFGGNQIEYRKGLVTRYCLSLVVWLEGPHPQTKWSVDQLKAITAEFRAKLKALKTATHPLPDHPVDTLLPVLVHPDTELSA